MQPGLKHYFWHRRRNKQQSISNSERPTTVESTSPSCCHPLQGWHTTSPHLYI